MNFRLTAILFAVVLALVVGLLIYALVSGDPAVATDGPFATLTSAGVKAEDITAVELTRTSPKEETLVFSRKDGKWRLTSPVDASVDANALDALVRDLLALKPVETSGPVERVNTGLSRPEVTVTLKAGDKSAVVHVGSTTFGQDQAVTYLVSAADSHTRPMAVLTRGLRASLFRPDAKDGMPATMVKWRTDFRPRGLLAGEVRDAESESAAITLSRGDKTLSLARTDDGWRFVTPALGRADANGATEPDPTRLTGVRPLLNAVLSLQTNTTSDVIEDVPAVELNKFGLAPTDNPLKVTYTAKGKPAQVLSIGNRLIDREGKPVVPSRHHVKLDGDAAVFLVTTDMVDRLTNTLNDPTSLLNRDLLPPSMMVQIDAIDSTFAGGFKLRKLVGGTDSWGVYGGGDPAEAQMQAVQNVLLRLCAPRVATEVLAKPDDAAFAGDSLQAKLKVWANGVDKTKAKLTDGKLPPEPPVTGDPMELWIGKQVAKNVTRPDGTTEERKVVIVRRILGKETTDLEVPLEVIALALQTRVKFINTSVPSFVPLQAMGLVLFRDGKRTEFAKNMTTRDPAYPQGVWNVGDAKGPLADGNGIFDLLNKLATLSPNVLMEKADDLKALGLDPANPKMSAKVTLPGEKSPRTEEYQFGEPVKGDDKSVYFKTVDKPFVYAVPAELVNRLRTADLSDKVAFRLDLSRVKKVQLRGWPSTTVDKTQAKVVAELQNGVWVAKEPTGAALDVVLLTAWLDALRSPKSVGAAPVEQGKEPPAAYGFGLDAVKLFIVSKGEKEGDPDTGLDLTLGATTADKTGIYALHSDGRCFLLDARPFLPLLPRPPLAAK